MASNDLQLAFYLSMCDVDEVQLKQDVKKVMYLVTVSGFGLMRKLTPLTTTQKVTRMLYTSKYPLGHV